MKRKGFTLIELMIVVVIIALLLTLLIPRVGVLIDKSRERVTQKNIKNIYAAIIQYAERKYGRMVWPAINNNPNNELKNVLTSDDPNINPYGPPFEEVPSALLRRGAKDLLDDTIESTQNNAFYAASGRNFQSDINSNDKNKGGWCYITYGTHTGEIFINANIPDTFGQIYSTYPCW